jgi:predicted PurR-regulated permease PerM
MTIDSPPGVTAPETAATPPATDVRAVSPTILASLAIVFLLRYAQDLFVPVVLAILVSYALTPVVNWFTWLKFPRALAAAVVLLLLMAATGLSIYALRGQFMPAVDSVVEAAQKVRGQIQEFQQTRADSESALQKLKQAAKEIEKTAAGATGASTNVPVDEPAFRANSLLWSSSMSVLSFLSQTVMVLFLVFFILASGDLFKRKIVRVIGTRLSEKRATVDAINEINGLIERFLLIQVLTGAIVGVATAAMLWFFGVHQPIIWGLAAGLFNSVPYFGAIIVTAGLALVSFLQFGTLMMTVEISGLAFAITSLEGFLLTPALMGKAAGINGVAMFFSLLFWSWLWGVIGVIVAVPIMMMVKSVCDRVDGFQAIGELLGE